MNGSLCVMRGVVYVGRHEKTAHVVLFDLDGVALPGAFSFRDPQESRAAATGLAVDDDRRVWIADTPADRVRAFHAFGREVATLEAGVEGPVAVAVSGGAEDLELVVGLGGTRPGAVLRTGPDLASPARLRSSGDPLEAFARVTDLCLLGNDLYVCEAGARRVQVFRDGEHHWSLSAAPPRHAGSEPRALDALPDGRLVVAFGGEASLLALLDASGDLVRVLATHGADDGQVLEPGGVAVIPGRGDRDTRVLAIDRDGDRLQVFTLLGRCYGAFPGLAG